MPSTARPPSTSSRPKSEYIETETGNKVARRAQLHGTQNIILGGRTVIQPGVCIRGDLVRVSTSTSTSNSKDAPAAAAKTKPAYNTSVTIGRYTFISINTLLRPPSRLVGGAITYAPLKIGDHTFVGEGCIIEAAVIGDHVFIGKGVVVGKMCVVKDWCKILEGSVLAQGMVVPSGVVVGGRPARIVGEVGEGWGESAGGGGGEGAVWVEGGDLRGLWRSVG